MLKNIIPNSVAKKKPRKTKNIVIDEFIEQKSYYIIALVGYVILGLIFFDYIHLLFPPKFFNPSWEIETIGKIVETSWILLLGFMLVFYRTQQTSIKVGELRILSILSRFALFIAIGYFLFVPLLLSNAIRINQNNKNQFSAQLTNQSSKVEQVFSQINQASNQEISSLLNNGQIKGFSGSNEAIKKQLIDIVQQRKQNANQKLQQSLRAKQIILFKSTFKWVIGTIVSGIAFVAVWRYTSWARSFRVE